MKNIDLKKLNDAYLMLLFLNRGITKKIMKNIKPDGSTVTEIMIKCRDQEHSQISNYLSKLKEYGFVSSVNRGIYSLYTLNENRIIQLNNILYKAKKRGLFTGTDF